MARVSKQEKAEAIKMLREWCPPGTKVYTVCRHVARSGMMRRLDLYVFAPEANGEVSKLYLTGYVAKALGWSRNDDGLRVEGCGMDMGFHTVHSLSYALHGNDPKGAAAIVASEKGRPFKPTADEYRPGYSLTQE